MKFDETYDIIKERIIKKRVIRNGKKVLKLTSDKDNYKIVDGKEVKMSPAEIRKRSKSAKKGAKKAKSKQGVAAQKRARSMKRT